MSDAHIEEHPDPLRLYAIIRGDLNMPAGKMCSQAGHAFLDAYLAALDTHPDIASQYRDGRHGVKVCLVAPTERHLLRAYEEAQKAGLPCALVIDQHHLMPPHFTGEPIITALGIGPARRETIHHITRRFSAYK